MCSCVPEEIKGQLDNVFQGAVPMGEAGWERARIVAGRPAAGHELTDLYNPLEAGLRSAVSVTKVMPLIELSWPSSFNTHEWRMGTEKESKCGIHCCAAGLLHRPGNSVKAAESGCCEAATLGIGPLSSCK